MLYRFHQGMDLSHESIAFIDVVRVCFVIDDNINNFVKISGNQDHDDVLSFKGVIYLRRYLKRTAMESSSPQP